MIQVTMKPFEALSGGVAGARTLRVEERASDVLRVTVRDTRYGRQGMDLTPDDALALMEWLSTWTTYRANDGA